MKVEYLGLWKEELMVAKLDIYWWRNLQVDWKSICAHNNIKYYACKGGVLIIYKDDTIRFIKNEWYDYPI